MLHRSSKVPQLSYRCPTGVPQVSMMVVGLHLAVVLLVLTPCSFQQEIEAAVHERVQRDVEGLMPFPRVGRRDTSLIDAREAPSDKRQGLIPFPRVGRSGNSEPRMARTWMLTQEGADNSKPSSSASATSPWFGPRLGRSQRRFETAANDSPWALIPIGMHRGQRGRESSFTPRLGRELDLGLALNDADEEELRSTGL